MSGRLASFAARLWPASWLRWDRLGLVGALLLYLSVSVLTQVTLPPYHGMDEGRHMGYVMALGEGRIPHVLDPIDIEKLQIKTFRGTNVQAAAAHPPLYHALIALPLKVALAHGDPILAVRFGRALSSFFGALSLVFAYRILRRLAPARPHLAVGGVAIVAMAPVYVNACSIVYNDALAVLAALAALDAAMVMASSGFSWRRYALCAFWLAVASLTRLTSFLAASGAVVAVGLAPLLDTSRRIPVRLAIGSARALGLVAAAAAASGWFYLRNIRIYGDISASSALLDRLNRVERGMLRAFFTWRWLDLFEHYWVRIVGGVSMYGGTLLFTRTFLVVVGIGLALVTWKRRRELRNAFTASPLLVQRLGALVLVLGTVMPVIYFFSKGGYLTPRYIMAAAWFEFGLTALGLSWTRRPWLVQTTIVLLAMVQMLTLEVYANKVFDDVPLAGGLPANLKPDDYGIVIGLRSQGIPFPEWWFMLALFAVGAGVMLVLRSLTETYRGPDSVESHDAGATAPGAMAISGGPGIG